MGTSQCKHLYWSCHSLSIHCCIDNPWNWYILIHSPWKTNFNTNFNTDTVDFLISNSLWFHHSSLYILLVMCWHQTSLSYTLPGLDKFYWNSRNKKNEITHVCNVTKGNKFVCDAKLFQIAGVWCKLYSSNINLNFILCC